MESSSNIRPVTASPAEMSEDAKAEFKAFVIAAGEVNKRTLPQLVKQAVTLVMLYDGHKLIGTAAIKHPYDEHRCGDFAKAKVATRADMYPLELGWIVVHPDYRRQGHASTLISEALGHAGAMQGIYATTKTDRMRALLPEFGFEKQGEPYPSTLKPAENLTLFGRAPS
ncbi:GNAT family N-acetyltransferase [Novosphingobium naphthalenivorans]|uniref:GNAT family N-acetyltransferase n=1 Tax=Novosphingobium naphthalenivorans TaxID=273168 RepID=UPI00082E33A4|nr:GNAT family N-acetyltransferase [Novosphingobium naphthalenivorans]